VRAPKGQAWSKAASAATAPLPPGAAPSPYAGQEKLLSEEMRAVVEDGKEFWRGKVIEAVRSGKYKPPFMTVDQTQLSQNFTRNKERMCYICGATGPWKKDDASPAPD